MKINKKGFVATSVLYSLAAIIAVVIFLMLANMKTMRNINRTTSNDIKEDLECIENGNEPNISFSSLDKYKKNNSNITYSIPSGTDINIPSESNCADKIECYYTTPTNTIQSIENTKELTEAQIYEITCEVTNNSSNKTIKKIIKIQITE